MPHLLRSLIVCSLLFTFPAFASQTVFKVAEQNSKGESYHHALDRSTIGDGLDPLLQFILLETPVDPETMQVIWEASEAAIPWARNASVDETYSMVENAILPEDGLIEYRVFEGSSGDELTSLRHTRSDEDGMLGIDPDIINDLPDGLYNLHAHVIVPERPRVVLMQRITVSDKADDEADDEGEEVDEERGPGTDAPTLEPGEGFNGETKQPDNIGALTTLPMARWDVVPLQEFRGEFEAGIVAHHSYGVDRVVISFNGGPWQAIAKPTLNPRTGVEEYWAKIDARDIKDGKVDLRAIVYPKQGKPRVMETLTLWANAGGSIDFPVYEIKPGDTEVPKDLDCPKDRWLTVKYAPGASQRVSFNLRTQGNVKLEGLNLKGGKGWQGAGNGGNAWFDDCDYLGTPSNFKAPANLEDVTTLWPVDYNWGYVYYTDFVVDHVGNPLNANHGIARNVHAKTVYEDGIRVYGLVMNVVIDRIVGGTSRTPKGDYIHTDMFQLSNGMDNCIYQNIVGKDIGGQGFSHGGVGDKVTKNCAFVNIDVNVTIQNIGLRLFGGMTNVLYENVKVRSPLGGEIADRPSKFEPEDVVLREVNPMPNGWQRKGIKLERLILD